jgi:Cof subfamily protein (haloacid dehalogenase superfamily)
MNIPDFKTIPRAIAIDLDGTLLNSQTQLSERNHRALERCIAHGIPVIIATSRPARIFNRIFPDNMRKGCSLVIMNGAVTKGVPPLSGHYRVSLPGDATKAIVKWAFGSTSRVRVTLELEGFEFATNWNWDPETLWQRNSATPDMVLSLEEGLSRGPCKIALGALGADYLQVAKRFTREFGGSLSIVPQSDEAVLNITSGLATKISALRKLLTPHGISLSEVLAFGDDLPDLDMLQACGVSIAMANAFAEVKDVCKYQTASNDEDGVAQVLEKMLSTIT